MELILHEHDLPLTHPFTISRGTITSQPTLIVELREDGLSGFGEAPETHYYHATVAGTRAALEALRPRIEAWELEDPAAMWDAFQPDLKDQSFALCALDCAAHDLWARRLGEPLHRLWGLDPNDAPSSSYTIGLDTTDRMIAKLEEMPGWPVYKLKVDNQGSIEIVKALREHTTAPFRVDANCDSNWMAAQINSVIYKKLGVELIEQPVDPAKNHKLSIDRHRFALPIFADESCVNLADVDPCVSLFHGINIKLTKCGGLTEARRMITRARERGLQLMVGCMTESSVGISAAAQIAPLVDYVDLDGAVLLAEDTATGVRVEQGELIFPDRPGTGVALL